MNNSEDNIFYMYHGGKRWSMIPSELIGSSKGRYEGGPGIYFTNNYSTASKYAKGGRVVQKVGISKSYNLIDNVRIDGSIIIQFVKNASGMRNKEKIITDLKRFSERTGRKEINLSILNNLVVNHEAGSGRVGLEVAKFFVANGGNVSIESKSGNEYWLIVFDPKILKSVKAIDPKSVGDSDWLLDPPPILR